jgi:hydrogenase/urease accessory protein HupE
MIRFIIRQRIIFVRLLIVSIVCLVCSRTVQAHDVSQSESRIEVHGREARVEFRLNLLELGYVDTNGNSFISYDELDNSISRIYADVTQHFVLRCPAPTTEITLERYRVIEDHVVDMELIYHCPYQIAQLSIVSTLSQITLPSHQHLTSVNLNGEVYEAILNASNSTAIVGYGNTPTLKTFWSFLRLGFMHIFTGYDHLAFLVGLLVVTTNLGSLIKIITSFTVAHSITLALATFDIVVLPSRLTESVIALSIAYVALENLLGKRTIERYRVVFIFGLAHGFGFSSVLREMELSRSHLALSLFSFNLGVEIGQITFVLILFPLIIYVASSKRAEPFQRSVSLMILCLALYWFLQRAFLI